MLIILRKKLFLLVTLGLFSFLTDSLAQSFVKQMPAKYGQPYEGMDLSPSNKTNGNIWVVFSDRNNNVSYETHRGRKVKDRNIGFLEQFYVLDDRGGFLKICKDPGLIKHSGQLSSQKKSFGWINKDHVLLWYNALVDKRSHIDKKCMTLNTISHTQDSDAAAGNNNLIEFYSHPKTKLKTKNTSKLYQVFYIYKKYPISVDEDMLLIATQSFSANVFDLDKYIKGWVSSKRIIPWDHRIALEPNWDKKAVRERQKKGVSIKFLIDEPSAKRYKKGNHIPDDFVFLELDYPERKIGDWRRFPVIGDQNNGSPLLNKDGLLKAGVMGEVQSGAGNITLDNLAVIQRKYNSLRANRRKINIFFG